MERQRLSKDMKLLNSILAAVPAEQQQKPAEWKGGFKKNLFCL